MRLVLRLLLVLAITMLTVSAASALTWKTSCGVDRGSIVKKGNDYTFKTSSNHCPGGVFNQRAEINTEALSVSRAASYEFEAEVAMSTSNSEEFAVFQIHDARDGCAPPLSVKWNWSGYLRFESNYTRGQGMDGCVENDSLNGAKYSGPKLKRDGTPYQLRVRIDFDGKGAFDVQVFIDGVRAISGRYEPSSDPAFVASKRFYLKHGVYSRMMFKYEMVSKGVRASKV